MNKFQIIKNGETNRIFDSLLFALEHMISSIQSDILQYKESKNQYELLYLHNSQLDTLVRFPDGIAKAKKKDFHPFLQKIIDAGIFDNDGYIHEINHNLLVLDELENQKYTKIEGNDNCLDLVKYLDATEYSLAYCSNCKSVQQCTVEGCEGLISFTCDVCKEVLFDAFRNT